MAIFYWTGGRYLVQGLFEYNAIAFYWAEFWWLISFGSSHRNGISHLHFLIFIRCAIYASKCENKSENFVWISILRILSTDAQSSSPIICVKEWLLIIFWKIKFYQIRPCVSLEALRFSYFWSFWGNSFTSCHTFANETEYGLLLYE